MNCPQCGSTQTKRFVMAYASGTSTTRRRSLGIGSTGRARGTSSLSTRQTKLAEFAAPPSGPSLALGCVGNALIMIPTLWVASLIIPVVARSFPSPSSLQLIKFAPLVYAGLTALIFLIGRLRYQSRKKRFAAETDRWERSWICQRCGATWAS